MPFSAAELANIANATLDHYVHGQPLSQTIKEKPLYNALRAKQKTFGVGKEFISLPVKGDYTTVIQGFSHDDTVGYQNPANIKRVQYPWKEIHAGISMTMTELKKNGISVVDTMDGAETNDHSDAEMSRLANLLDDKLEDLAEGWARGFNTMLWADGTQDPLQVPGIKSIIVDNPATGIVGGLSGATFSWWRNRSLVGANKITSASTNGGVLVQVLQKEYRQLRKFGGKPDLWLAGSDFINALETELRANGTYSQDGFTSKGKTDMGIADIYFKGNPIVYDPTLDDNGESKRLYIIDTKHITLDTMEGEDMRTHTPARPADKYVLFRAMTYTGGLICDMRSSSGVYEIA